MKSSAGKIFSSIKDLFTVKVFAQVANLCSPVSLSINCLKWHNQQRLEENCTEIETGQNNWFKKTDTCF